MKRQRKKITTGFVQELHSVCTGLKITTIFILFTFLFFIPKNGFGETGKEIYNKLCASCHSLSNKELLGPGFNGLSERRSEEWLIKWIRDSQGLIATGDEEAVKLLEEYNGVPMPGFPQLTDEEIREFIAFVDKNSGEAEAATASGDAVSSSTSNTASNSDTEMDKNIQLFVWTAVSLLIFAFLLFRFKKKTLEALNQSGFHSEPHIIPNYFGVFAKFLLVASGIIFLLIKLLEHNVGMINNLMFVVLPYLCFGVFLIGSIYRYKNRGFQVSSLSSQFLEGKKLFWGSLPFHWGLVVIFTGHLIAFLFPSTVLAWNGQPIRLLILEVASFAFGLSILLGLILLIKRRFASKMILVVTNKMDIVVYTILLVQVLSGLGVAFYVRWGSSWFASVLTPYLRSIFSFRPDINSVSEMPWLIQIHIVSAFVIIGIIPFTRFMHFLVAPFDYAWRRYQLVIWNWNPRKIRTSTKHNFGKRPRNH